MDAGAPLQSPKIEPLARASRPAAQGVGQGKASASVEAPPQTSVNRVAKELGVSTERSAQTLEENRAALQKAIEELRAASRLSGRELGFRVDEAIDRSIVTVSDAKSGKVIRQIPEEVVVRVAQSIEQLKGLLFDDSF
jgi:flagellar protein FlaG